MAVYTEVTDEELSAFIATYDIGTVLSCKGIAEGVENTNYFLHTSGGSFILTLYEKRVREADLPFFLGLMEHLARRGLTCPQPVRNRSGQPLGRLAGRPAAIINFLDGLSIRRPTARHCGAVGEALARLHLAGRDFPMQRPNALSLSRLAAALRGGGRGRRPRRAGPRRAHPARARRPWRGCWPTGLPSGVIHADLFTDNVFFIGDAVSGLIDFYFACTDAFAYDLAICLNAWCFEPDLSFNVTKARAMISGYRDGAGLDRAGSGRVAGAVPRLGAALHADAAGRLAQRAARRARQAERPARIRPQARLPSPRRQRRRIRARAMSERVTIYTDGACSGNPGPGGWGALLLYGGRERELSGGEALTTNNRMELTAAIMALEGLTRPCTVDLFTDSQYVRDGITKWLRNWQARGWRTADKKPVKNEDLWRRLDAARQRHQVVWHWVRGHADDPLNHRVDALAVAAMTPFKKKRIG